MARALVGRGARADLPRRAQGRRLAQAELPRSLWRRAADQPSPARPGTERGAACRHSFGQRRGPRAPCARRHARRHPGGADLARVLAHVAGLRQAQAHLRARAARARVRRRRGEIRAGARGGGREVDVGGRASGKQPRLDTGARARARRAADGGEDSFYLGLDRHAERCDQYARHAVREPAAARAGVAVRRGPAAGGGRLAALEPHLRRQSQFQPGAAQRRHAVRGWRQAAARVGRDDGEELGGALADDVLQRAARLRPLLPYLERDEKLRQSFFRELDVLFYAAASLPQNLWDRLKKLGGPRLAMLSAWGSTETSPLATSVHFHMDRPGVIGLPIPECELKLVPTAGKLEVRVRGPNVMPGYYKRPDLTREAFDEEGFYRIGDAVKFADVDDPAKGIVFDGRVAEDFKLTSGTWVNVSAVRVKLIAAADPLVQDAVITGHDRAEIGALVFLSAAAKDRPDVRERLRAALAKLAAEGGSSTHPRRLLVMSEPPSIDANEITDKGYINQRAVLERRAALLEKLYAGGEGVITAG